MKKNERKSTQKSAPRKSLAGLKALTQSRRLLIGGGGILLLVVLASWLWWTNGESNDTLKYVDGIAVNQPGKNAKPRTVLWEKPRLVLNESEETVDQYDPTLSADELTLVLVRGRAHPDVGADLYQIRRASVTEPWGKPKLLPGEINTTHDEIGPELSLDGRWLFFASDRPGGRGGYDIWVSSRNGDGWSAPVNIGDEINTEHDEIDPAWFVRPNVTIDNNTEPKTFKSGLYFASNRPKATAAQPKAPQWKGTLRGRDLPKPDDYDIFLAQADFESSRKKPDIAKPEKGPHQGETKDEAQNDSSLNAIPTGSISAPILKAARRLNHVNTSAREGQPALTPRGDFLYFSSNRQGARGNRKDQTDLDLYRARIYPPKFHAPENVGSPVNTAGDDTDPFLFGRGHSLLFSSNLDNDNAVYNLFETHTREPVLVAIKEPAAPATDTGSGFATWFEKYQWWILLLILALLAMLWLLKKFLDEEQRRRLSLMQSCLLSSLMLHLLLAFLLSLWVISEAIYKVIREQTPEIAVQEKQLAQERMALNLREQTTQLPQIQTPLPTEQKSEQQSVVEVRPQQASIELETQEATSQSFAAQPQQVQPSPTKLDKLEFIEPQSSLEHTQQALAIPMEESDPRAEDSQQLAQASSDVKVAQAQTEAPTPQALTLKPVENQPTQQPTAKAKAVPTEAKTTLTPLQMAVAKLNTQQPTPQTLTVPLEESGPQTIVSQQLAHASSEVKVAKAQTEAAIPQVLTSKPVENQPTQQPTAKAKAVPTEAKTTLTPLQMAVAKLNAQQPTTQTLTVPLEESGPSQSSGQLLAQVPAGLKIDPKETARPPANPKVKPSQSMAVAKLNLTPEAVQKSTSAVENLPLQPLAIVKLTTASIVQQSITSIKLEQPIKKSDTPAVELKMAKSNRTATAAVASTTRGGIPLTAATSVRPVSQLRLETVPIIKGASKSELTPKLLNFPSGVEMAKLPEVNLDVDIKLDSAPEHDGPMLLRDPEKRKGLIEQLGGSNKTEEAIKRALDWFTRNQKPDGHWYAPEAHYAAATGMAMLAYMGWGAKHNEPGPYQEPLKKAMQWMMKTERNGDLRGSNGHNFMYDHGIAAIAMAEAYSLTKDPKLRPVVDRVVGFTVRAQNPKTGGWRYRPYEENGYRDRGDMSVTGWQIMALKSAQFGGIDVPLESLDRALKYMDSIGGGKRKSIYGYTSKGDPKPAMVSEGMFCQQLLRQHAIDQRSASPQDINLRLEESAKYLEKNLPNPRRLKYNYYYWYYACLALHQQQGSIWESWNARMRPVFLKAQVKRPGQVSLDGSWDPIGEWGPKAGRCIITGMATLSLEVYYRYLPMYNSNQD